jgi:rSAM/selenodomain-associated transferase 1
MQPTRPSSAHPRTTLGVFGKHWAPGTVKTRLAETIGREAAAELYRAFLVRTLERFSGAAHACVLAFWPPERHDAFEFAQVAGWRLQPQTPGDLGHRMQAFFAEAFSSGAERVVLIGSDSPTLPWEYVADAFDRLESNDAVLGPACDGGYYLVGAARETPPIFDNIPWSTADVFRETIACLERARIPFALAPEWCDVDQHSDLIRLQHELHSLAASNPGWRPLRDQLDQILLALDL